MRDETIFPEEKIANNFETICTFSTAERNLSIWTENTWYNAIFTRKTERGERRRSGDRSRGEYKTKSNTYRENQEGISLVREEKF